MATTKSIPHLLFALSRRLPSWLFRHNAGTIFHTDEIKLPTRPLKNYHIRQATMNDVKDIVGISGANPAFVRRRMQSGDPVLVTVADSDQEVVTVQWAHCGRTYIRGFNLIMDLEPETAYLYGAYSKPQVRLTGIFNNAFQQMLELLEEKGVRHYTCLVEFHNKPAKLYHQRLRFKVKAEVSYTKILFLRFNTWRDCQAGTSKLSLSFREPSGIDTI